LSNLKYDFREIIEINNKMIKQLVIVYQIYDTDDVSKSKLIFGRVFVHSLNAKGFEPFKSLGTIAAVLINCRQLNVLRTYMYIMTK